MTNHQVVWWETETPDPVAAQHFSGELFGWTFRRDFDGPSSQLDRVYWIAERTGRGIGGLHAARFKRAYIPARGTAARRGQ